MKKSRFVVVPNLETQGEHTFWDIVEANTGEIWAEGYYSKYEAEYKAEMFAKRFDELKKLPKWRPKYKGRINAQA